jgi:hypothetical protein
MSHALFDALQTHFKCANDTATARHLDIGSATVTKYRYGTNKIGPGFILRLYDMTGWSIEQIRSLMTDPRRSMAAERNDAKRAIAAKKKAATLATMAKRANKTKPRNIGTADANLKRLTVTKAAQWTSTVHRVM